MNRQEMDKCRILVVDDDESLREMLRHALNRRGYRVTLAASGEEALAAFHPGSFDIMLLDLMLPKMDGLELMKKLRRKDPAAAFLIITGYPSLDSAIDSSTQGVYDYVTKPFRLGDIFMKIEEVLEKQKFERSIKALRNNLGKMKRKMGNSNQ